jgi:Domain of unknown function (DUF4386)
MHVISDSQRSAAKVAALAFLISFALVVYSNFGLRADLFAGEDLAEMVRRVTERQAAARLSVVFDLGYATGMMVLLSALYVVLGPVNRYLALLASVSKLVYAFTAILLSLTFLTVVRLATDPAYSQRLGAEPLQALVKLNHSATWEQYYVGLVFWALSSMVFGWLWFRSRYVPPALAMFGVASSAWCVFCTVAYIMNPAFSSSVNVWLFDTPMILSYVALSVWLLWKGLPGAAASRASI